MTNSNPAEGYSYNEMHAVVIDALRYEISSEAALEHAAHEVLQRLRDTGLAIPAKSIGTEQEAAN